MSYWVITDTKRSEVKNSYLITKTKDGGKPIIHGEVSGCMHSVLISIAGDLSPGDVLDTPEGSFYFHKANWANNN
jgi:hypothetical protein